MLVVPAVKTINRVRLPEFLLNASWVQCEVGDGLRVRAAQHDSEDEPSDDSA